MRVSARVIVCTAMSDSRHSGTTGKLSPLCAIAKRYAVAWYGILGLSSAPHQHGQLIQISRTQLTVVRKHRPATLAGAAYRVCRCGRAAPTAE